MAESPRCTSCGGELNRGGECFRCTYDDRLVRESEERVARERFEDPVIDIDEENEAYG